MSAAAPAPGAPLHPAGSSGAAAPTLTVPPAAGVVEEQSSSAGAFLQSGLTLLYKYASKKHEALRHQCVEVLSKIKAEEKSRAEKLARGQPAPLDSDANKYFLPLKLACDTGQAKLVAIALDTMEKLIAYGYLDGNAGAAEEMYPKKTPATGAAATKQDANAPTTDPAAALAAAPGATRKLISVMIETLYECSMYKDPLVQRQVVKALLTTVSSVSCPVHDHGLLQSVTSLYQIYLQAGDETNRTTSKAALTQIFNIVFQRMEHFAAQLKELEATERKQREQDKLTQKVSLNDEASASTNGDASSSNSASGASTTENAEDSSSSTADDNNLHLDVDTEARPVEPSIGADESDGGTDSTAATPRNGVVGRVSPSMGSRPPPGKRGYCVVCSKPANAVCLQTRDPVCGMECKLVNLGRKDPNRMAALSVKNKIQQKLQILQNDAYYLLRALIKLSHKSFLTVPPEQAAVDSKLLSLSLLLSVMQNAGPTFETNKNFIQLIKVDLVNCLLRNSAASNIDTIFTLASNIFVALLAHFKPHLHAVIGPMLDSIYLPYIQSPNSSFEHKQTSLLVVKSVCEDHQLIVELFLNYDCSTDLASFQTFQKIASLLEKVTQKRVRNPADPHDAGGSEESHLTPQEETRLRNIALEALVGCTASLASWTTRLVKPNAQAMQELSLAMEHANSSGTAGGRTTALAAIGAAAAAAAMNNGQSEADKEKEKAKSRSLSVSDPDPLPSPSPPLPAPSAGVTLASSFSTQFQLARAAKQKMDAGIAKFNQKPKVGIAYLQQHNLLGTEPADIAAFFHNNNGPNQLDKIQLGDYMGDEHDFNKKVLYAYVERMQFRGQSFDDSIRDFVQGFRLPGEAQKIDRMMEKFAEQYHKHNPGRFHSADTAYVLAYSIILLNTDAHNPGVKRRMTKEDFFKNCRGIDDGKDIDPAFLGEIYDRITTNEIKMKDDPLVQSHADGSKGKGAGAASTNPNDTKRRFTAFVKESQQMVRRTQELIKTVVPAKQTKLSSSTKKELAEVASDQLDQPEAAAATAAPASGDASNGAAAATNTTGSSSETIRRSGSDVPQEKTFYQATDADAEVIRPMFDLICFPSLAAFSVLIEESEDEHIIRLCLNGYRSSIRIANALELQTARLAFVTSLKKTTFLGSGKTMKPKQVEAISALLGLAAGPEGNHLRENWLEVLQSISEVERLHLIANNSLRGRESNFSQELVSGHPAAGSLNTTAGMRTGGKEVEALNSLQVHLIDSSAIDRVFAASAYLDGEAIVDFVNALRQVSEQELANVHAPRVFSLQKMVEITYANMGRIRVVWNRIWSILSEFFQKAGCHPHLNVSMYAIDSLRQLAMKFLEKDELTSYQFQKHFFKPFEFIMIHNPTVEIREFVLQVIDRMIQARVNNIKSGWKGVFLVLTVAANAQNNTIAPSSHGKQEGPSSLTQLAFQILSNIMENYFPLISETGLETMDEAVNCCVTFGCNEQYADIATKSIQFLTNCALTLNREASTVGAVDVATASNAALNREPSSGTPTHKVGPLPSAASIASNSQVTLKVWFLVLTGLSRMIGDTRAEVRSLALSTLFHILNSHGHVFSTATWRAVFHGVLFPIFDDVRYANEKPSFASAHGETALAHMHAQREREAQVEKETANLWKEQPAVDESKQADGAPSASPLSAGATGARKDSGSAALPPKAPSVGVLTPLAGHRTVASHDGAQRAPNGSQRSRKNSTATAASQAAQFDHSWLQTTCFTALSSLVDLYARFHSTVHFLLPEVLKLINSCISQSHAEDLAKIGVRCFVVLLQKIGSDLSVGDWWIVLQASSDILEKIIPKVLTSPKLRETLGLPPTEKTGGEVYQPFLTKDERAERPTTAPAPASLVSPEPPVVAPSSDVAATAAAPQPAAAAAHNRSASAALPASSSILPFSLPPMLTRIKVQLWLVEAIFQITMSFFPKTNMGVVRLREDQLVAELAVVSPSAAEEPLPQLPMKQIPPIKASVFNQSDRRVLGCFTPAQALFSVDLLGECINFTHVFNADVTLRRKLHNAGLHIPVPTVPSHIHQPIIAPVAIPTTPQPSSAVISTVPASPAPVPHVHPVAVSAPPAAPAPASTPNQSLPSTAAGPAKPARLPQLFYHEAHALRLAMDILFKLVTEGRGNPSSPERYLWDEEIRLSLDANAPMAQAPVDAIQLCEERIIYLCHSVIDEYIHKTQSGQLVSVESMDESMVGLLNNFAAFPAEMFQRYLPEFYTSLTQLIEYANVPSIRHSVRLLFEHNIRGLLQLEQPRQR